jgi:phosphatidylserine decarboxylase
MSEIVLYDRRSGELVNEVVYEEWFMDLFYGTRPGRWFTELVLKPRLFSRLYGLIQRRPSSRDRIASFVERHGIDPTESERPPGEYPSFAAFFARRLKPERRPVDRDREALITPADGRLLALPVREGGVYPVKGAAFGLEELAPGASLEERYREGLCLILRLAPADYHRFCYLDDGVQSPVETVPGGLHSVSPLALRHGLRVFPGNHRHFCTLDTRGFGPIFQMEVGALTVGSIHQVHPEGGPVRRGEEKGWFELGGSTIILLLRSGRARVDDDVVRHSRKGVETVVRLGERIGVRRGEG